MRLEFTYTAEDFQEMLEKMAPKKNTGRKRSVRPAIMGLLIITILIVLTIWHNSRRGVHLAARPAAPTEPGISSYVVAAFMAVIGILVFFAIRNEKRAGLLAWKNDPAAQMPVTVDIDDEGVRSSIALSTTFWKWEAFASWLESEKNFLLVMPGKKYLGIPKRAVADPAALDEMRRFLQSHITPPIGGFPVLPVKTP